MHTHATSADSTDAGDIDCKATEDVLPTAETPASKRQRVCMSDESVMAHVLCTRGKSSMHTHRRIAPFITQQHKLVSKLLEGEEVVSFACLFDQKVEERFVKVKNLPSRVRAAMQYTLHEAITFDETPSDKNQPPLFAVDGALRLLAKGLGCKTECVTLQLREAYLSAVEIACDYFETPTPTDDEELEYDGGNSTLEQDCWVMRGSGYIDCIVAEQFDDEFDRLVTAVDAEEKSTVEASQVSTTPRVRVELDGDWNGA